MHWCLERYNLPKNDVQASHSQPHIVKSTHTTRSVMFVGIADFRVPFSRYRNFYQKAKFSNCRTFSNLHSRRGTDNSRKAILQHQKSVFFKRRLQRVAAKPTHKACVAFLFPRKLVLTFPTALAAPVEEGMMLNPAPRPPRQSFFDGPSTVFCVAVTACTVVMRPSFRPKVSLITWESEGKDCRWTHEWSPKRAMYGLLVEFFRL